MKNQQGAPEALYASAMEFAAEKASISYVQRKCRCSWNDAEQMLERMVREGIIATYNGRKSTALVDAQQPATHVQNPAGIEHVAGDVSKNGAEVNTNVYAELPPRYYLAGGVEKTWDQQQMCVFADATHALRAQQPAPATQQAGDALGYTTGITWTPHQSEQVKKITRYAQPEYGYNVAIYTAPQPSPTPQADSQPAPVLTSETGGDWTQPTTIALRLGDAMQLLCGGKRPPDDMVQQWLDNTSESLQEFAASNGPAWAQGIGLIDAAMVMVDQPTEIRTIDNPDRDHEHRAARAQADSVTAPAATPTAASIAWTALRDLTDPLGEAGVKIMGHVRIYAQRQYEAGLTEGRATPPAQAADSALEDAAGLDWLALAGPASICVVIDREHDGEVEVSTDDVTGYGKTLREAIDAARKKGGA